MKLFVYGTLKRGGAFNDALYDCKFITEATAQNVAMFDWGSYPVIIRSEGDWANGEIWEVNKDALAHCDRIESHPFMYKRELINIDGHECWIYIYQREVSQSQEKKITDFNVKRKFI